VSSPDFLILGGGIIGISVAREVKRLNPPDWPPPVSVSQISVARHDTIRYPAFQ